MAYGANRRSGEPLAAPIGEAGQIRSANMKFSRIFLCLLHFAYWRSTNRSAQHKDNKRIGEARLTIRSASPIVIEIA